MQMPTIFISVGELEDPLPDEPKETRFWLTVSSCPKCRFPARDLEWSGKELSVRCPKCLDSLGLGLPAALLPEVTFVFWCNSSRFASDEVVLPVEARRDLEKFLGRFEAVPAPYWAVKVLGGVCLKAPVCTNEGCRYHQVPRLEGGRRVVIPFTHRQKRKRG